MTHQVLPTQLTSVCVYCTLTVPDAALGTHVDVNRYHRAYQEGENKRQKKFMPVGAGYGRLLNRPMASQPLQGIVKRVD